MFFNAVRPALAFVGFLLLGCAFISSVAGEARPTPPAATAAPLIATEQPTLTPAPTPTPAPEARAAEGDRARFYGDWERALREYSGALAQAPGPDLVIASRLGVAHTHFQASDHATSLRELREIIAEFEGSPQLAPAYFLLGQVFERLERYPEAVQAFDQYLALRPGQIDHYVHVHRGDSLARAGLPAEALEAYQAALQAPHLGSSIELEIRIAEMHAAAGNFELALSLFADLKSRVTNDYTQARINLLIGQTYTTLGNLEAAYAIYRESVENYPLSYDSYSALVALVDAGIPVDELDRGLVDYFAGQYGVALAAFNRYLTAEPENHDASPHYYKALALRALDDYGGAILEFDQVILTHPGDPLWHQAWEQKVFTLWAFMNNHSEAARTALDFVAAAPVHPQAPEFLLAAGQILERDGNLQDAAAVWERAAVEYPNADIAYRALFLASIAQYRLADYARASEYFQRTLGLAQTPEQEAAVHLWLGKSAQIRGQDALAQASLERAVAADPTGYYSERARDLLLKRPAFDPPGGIDLGIDHAAERAAAEDWLRTVFGLPADTNLSDLGSLRDDPRLVRGRELWELGLYAEARSEFENLRESVRGDPVDTYRLANYLIDLGLYRSGLLAARRVLTLAGLEGAATLTAPQHLNHILYGTYYRDLVLESGRENEVDPLFLFSVMRQESLFEGFISSSAGARGLMQIIPSTGQGIHNLMGWPPNYTADDLYRPLVSVRFGADHLADLRRIFDGDLYATLAGYNAGQGNAAIWKELSAGDQDLYLEIVRFQETRLYIRRIYENYAMYRRLYGRAP